MTSALLRRSSRRTDLCAPTGRARSRSVPTRPTTAEMWTNTSLPPPWRLDEAVALLRIEPLHGTCRHLSLLPSRIYNPGKQAPIALA